VAGDGRGGRRSTWKKMARLLVPAAAPGVAPIVGELAGVLAELRREIGWLRAELRRGNSQGGSVRREEEIGVKEMSGGGLLL
jgi:hypothetical protein